MGHMYALGNTEEELIMENVGTAGRGLECDGAFDHAPGVGFVNKRTGVYDDAFAKKNTLLLLISEVSSRGFLASEPLYIVHGSLAALTQRAVAAKTAEAPPRHFVQLEPRFVRSI